MHWACFAGAEATIAYLVAWGADVNAEDANGITPLQLAVRSADAIRSTRSVRHLLIRGADRDHKDHFGRRAIDFIEKERYTSPKIKEELRQYLVSIITLNICS